MPQQRRRLRFGPEAGLVVVIVVIVVALILIHNHHASNGPGAGAAVTPSNTGHKHIHKHKAKGKTVTKTATKTTPTVTTKAKVALAATTADGVWVCVEGPNNKVLVRGQVYTDGEKIPTATGAKLLVSLGNTDVKATVNGKSYPIVSSTSANGLVAFEATPTGTHALTTGPTCGE